jgi:tetratricopeptide (TPR) repeat protein
LAQADMHEADRMVIRAVTNALKPVLMPARRVTPEQRRQADAIVAKARIRLNRGEYRNSLDMLDQAIQLDPQSALAYNSRGYAHLRLKEYQLAIDDFTVAINLRNGYTNAMHNLEVARKLGGFRNSRPEQLIAVSSDAEDPDFGGPDHE